MDELDDVSLVNVRAPGKTSVWRQRIIKARWQRALPAALTPFSAGDMEIDLPCFC